MLADDTNSAIQTVLLTALVSGLPAPEIADRTKIGLKIVRVILTGPNGTIDNDLDLPIPPKDRAKQISRTSLLGSLTSARAELSQFRRG